MPATNIEAKSILRVAKKIDSFFVSRFGMNIYRGCSHNCSYCDGRAEQYRVDGDFAADIAVKANAISVLRDELSRRVKRGFPSGFALVGGGVCDAYQHIEAERELTRKALMLLRDHHLPVHVLTKSLLVERDADVLSDIREQKCAVISVSFSTADDAIASRFEPGVPLPTERFAMLARMKERGFCTGIYLMPLLPFVSDSAGAIDAFFARAKGIGVDFIIAGGLTLKDGRQRTHFENVLSQYDASLMEKYRAVYRGNKWGMPEGDHFRVLKDRIRSASERSSIPLRMPMRIWRNIVTGNDRAIVILEQIAYMLELRGERSPYGYAAHAVSLLSDPLSSYLDLSSAGINAAAEKIIRGIIASGTSSLYEELMR